MPRHALTPAERTEIVRLYHAGATVDAIAARIGAARGTISSVLTRARRMGQRRAAPLPAGAGGLVDFSREC